MAELRSVQARRQILRYLLDSGLRPGDRLPSYSEMRRMFGFGSATLMTAVRQLQSDGVLEVHDKVGVYLRCSQTCGLGARTVALTGSSLLQSPYYSSLAAVLQKCFSDAGCRVLHFGSNQDVRGKAGLFSIDDFPGFRQALENDEIQGVIHLDDFKPKSLKEFTAYEIPLFFVGALGTSPNGLFYDFLSLLEDMISVVPVSARARTVLVLPKVIRGYCEETYYRLGCTLIEDTDLEHLDAVADHWIAHPDQLPSQLLILDDLCGLHLLSRLAVALPQAQMPPVSLLTNKQLMLTFPVKKLTIFQLDFWDFSHAVVDHLMESMRHHRLSSGQYFYRIPQLKR